MPNRLIKSSIHESEKVNQMTDFQFRVWVSLITYVDDYGRGDARPLVIKGNCFPLRERMTSKDIEAALNALAGIGCVGLYEVGGRPYLYFPNWESHQNIRNKASRYPAPEEGNCKQMNSIDGICNQMNANVPVIQSNPNPKKNPNPICSRFAEFWESYPRKVAKVDAEKAWNKLNASDDLIDQIIQDVNVRKHGEDWMKDNGKFIPYPATYLNQQRWEDEAPVSNHGYEEHLHTGSDLDHLLTDLDE